MKIRYVIAEPRGNMSSEEVADKMTKKIYKSLRPPSEDNSTKEYRYFGYIKHPTEDLYALAIQPDREIKIHPNKNLNDLLDNIKPDLPQQAKDAIGKKMKNRIISVSELFPKKTEMYTYEEMVDKGWIQTDEEI